MDKLEERMRSSAKAFREHPVYDSEGDGCYLGVQADELDEGADEITRLKALIDELVNGLEGLFRFANGVSYTITLGKTQIARIKAAEALISKARSSGKAGSDA